MNRKLASAALSLTLLSGASADVQGIEVMRNGSRPTATAAVERFTGKVLLDPLFTANSATRAGAGHVTFEPGARSAWHTHPAGQILVVTSGQGWVQDWGGEKREIGPGDVVYIPPGVKHWHGATATNRMEHIAIQETIDGRNVNWLEKVSEEQYGVPTTQSELRSAKSWRTLALPPPALVS